MHPIPRTTNKQVIDDFEYTEDNSDESMPNFPVNYTNTEPQIEVNLESLTPLPPRRSSRLHTTPKWHADYTVNQTSHISNLSYTQVAPEYQCFLTNLTGNPDPIHFKMVVQNDHWRHAMNLELEALETNETWEVTTLPPGKTATACKWIYKSKYNPDGTLERHKARLVILGCR